MDVPENGAQISPNNDEHFKWYKYGKTIDYFSGICIIYIYNIYNNFMNNFDMLKRTGI